MRMVRAINRKTLSVATVRVKGDPPVSDDEWIYDPDLSSVADHPRKFWKIDGDSVRLMTEEEQAEVVKAERAERVRIQTRRLLELARFEYPISSGRFFELTLDERVLLIGVRGMTPGTYSPMAFFDVDGGRLDLGSRESFESFYDAAFGAYHSVVSDEHKILDQMQSGSTVAEVESVADGRRNKVVR